MKRNKVEIVGLNTARLKSLNREEFEKGLKLYRSGAKDELDYLVVGNLKLVLSVINKYHKGSETPSDLFQVGVIGLIKAIENFDLEKKLLFSTYAVPMINGEIKRYLRDNTLIKVSRKLKDFAYRALKEKERYLEEFSKEPSVSFLAERLEISELEVKEALDSSMSLLSLQDPLGNNDVEDIYLIDQIEDHNYSFENFLNLLTLKDALIHLRPNLKGIIYQRYFQNLTQNEIARLQNVSQAQISRLEKEAINELRKFF